MFESWIERHSFVVLRHSMTTCIPRVDGSSIDPPGLGRHNITIYKYYIIIDIIILYNKLYKKTNYVTPHSLGSVDNPSTRGKFVDVG